MPDRTYEEVLGSWLVNHAETVEDMGHRVADVLSSNPRDHHYAGSKLSTALGEATKALALIGWSESEILQFVRESHETGLRYQADLRREFEESE